nr:MAG TPA: hypothetical protein [Caudoviricetes sp.]
MIKLNLDLLYHQYYFYHFHYLCRVFQQYLR